jgi:hypothetical protein
MTASLPLGLVGGKPVKCKVVALWFANGWPAWRAADVEFKPGEDVAIDFRR